MSPTRRFFTKAIALPPKPPKVKHRRQLVMARAEVPATGVVAHRAMSSRQAAQQAGRSKGAMVNHASGKGHRWTSEQARKMAKRMWKKHPVTRTGRHLGIPTKRRKMVMRTPLRERYTACAENGIHYVPLTTGGYWERIFEGTRYRLSERAALEALGHLPPKTPRTAFVPEVVRRFTLGTVLAGTEPLTDPVTGLEDKE